MSTSRPGTSARIVRQALEFSRPDRLPAFDGFWSEFADRWRTEKGLPAAAAIEDAYAIDLAVPVASEQLFPSRLGAGGSRPGRGSERSVTECGELADRAGGE